MVRIGHPARLEPSVVQYSLDALVANSDSAGIILDVRKDIDKAYVRVCPHFHVVQPMACLLWEINRRKYLHVQYCDL